MKWSVVLLLVLGLAAAFCAALLVYSAQSSRSTPITRAAVEESTYLVAARDLEARTVVPIDAVDTVQAEPDQLPPSSYAQASQVVGRVLRRPLRKGEPYTHDCLATGDSGVWFAEALQKGMRAVSVPLADSAGLENLLYPGCVVDVITTVDVREEATSGGQPVSITLLQGILVLAVGDQTVVSPTRRTDEGALVRPSTPSHVTLRLDAKQAEVLFLARQRGTVALALRNPQDTHTAAIEGTRLQQLGPVFAEAEERARERQRQRDADGEESLKAEREKRGYDLERARYDIERARKEYEIAQLDLERRKAEAEVATASIEKPQWSVRILRGGAEEVKKFDLAGEKRD